MTPAQLPNELWFEIFGHLDYFTLKECQRVSKTFKDITTDQRFDRVLFRCDTVPPYNPWTICIYRTLHPALDKIHCGGRMPTKLAGSKTFRLSLATAAEQATTPPVASVKLRYPQVSRAPISDCVVQNTDGVTIGAIFEAFDRKMKSSVGETLKPQCWYRDEKSWILIDILDDCTVKVLDYALWKPWKLSSHWRLWIAAYLALDGSGEHEP